MAAPSVGLSIAAFVETYLDRMSQGASDNLVERIEAATKENCEAWLASGIHDRMRISESDRGLEPPRDVVSFLLDFALPVSLTRTHEHSGWRSEELRQLARELDEQCYICLLAVYACRRGDHDGLRRAWDVFTNDASPYRLLFRNFRHRSDAHEFRKSTKQRNMEIQAKALKLERQGKPLREINGILAKQFKLSHRHIANIRKKTGTI